MKNVGEVKNCAGCYACESVCPKKCITYKQDEKGFCYPIIDYDKCINCGKCLRACAQLKDVEKNAPKASYAIKHKSEKVRYSSTSGGFFTAISDYFLNIQGVIYGATLKEDCNVEHIAVSDEKGRNLLRKSKYLQSNLSKIYRDVKTKLDDGKVVLFTGTPCQVAALKIFLNKDYDNLYTCDVICHGVPSKDVFKQYVKLNEDRIKEKVESIDFRTKKFGQKAAMNLKFKKKEYSKVFDFDEFGTLYTSGYIMRESCYSCRYATKERVSDMTMGDFWGIDKLAPEFDDNKGISMVLVNTEKGELLLEKIRDSIDCLEVPLEQCVKMQEQLQYPIKKASLYDEFWKDYDKNKIATINKYSRKIVLKNKIVNMAQKFGFLNIYLKIRKH